MSAFRKIKVAAALSSALVLAACASGYSEYYRPAQGATPAEIASFRQSPPSQQPLLERSAPPGRDSDSFLLPYVKRGYALIGTSGFNSGRDAPDLQAVDQARAVGADLVVVFEPRFTGSSTTAVPFTVPTKTTTYSAAAATAVGPRGAVNAFGTGVATTYGSATTLVPVTVHRSDYGAAYFVKRKVGLGFLGRNLNDTERQLLQTNKGVVVIAVVDNSPAFNADILSGDILLAVDGEPVINQEGLSKQLNRQSGARVNLSLYRSGTRIEKVVEMGGNR